MPLIVNGWTILFHDMMIDQMRNLTDAAARARRSDPEGFRSNANWRVLAAVAKLVLRTVPDGPGRLEYRQGNTLGTDYRHWFRAKFAERFHLFFRYDSAAKIIVFVWVNDQSTLRARGGRNDPYAVFQAMLERGNPPDDWNALMAAAKDPPADIISALQDA